MTGNTVVDALHYLLERLPRLAPPPNKLILVTAHRRESFGEPMKRICRAIRDIVERHPEAEVLYPVHPNPNVREPVFSILGAVDRVNLVEPMDYLEFVQVLHQCHIALTDSGGVQEEAPVLGKPVLVMRDHTERLEAVDAGCARLVGTDRKLIVKWAGKLLDNEEEYRFMSRPVSPFGDGHAAPRIVQAIEAFLAQDDEANELSSAAR
jgi:UDP-N-acetylglucosamine 2-epimerase (non-hydrolysing)